MDGLLRAYLIGPAVYGSNGQADVVLVEPNGDEHQVICTIQRSGTAITYSADVGDYLNDRYGAPHVCSVVRRAAMGMSRRPNSSEVAVSDLMLTQRITEAFEFARLAHQSQVRKGSGVPYLAHPLVVAGTVLDAGGDEDEAIAALLHDVIEDGGGEEALVDISRLFGDRVASIVSECSDNLGAAEQSWRARKEAHLAAMRSASYSALLVFAADKLHNALSVATHRETLKEEIWDRFKGEKQGTLWYYRESVNLLMDLSTDQPELRSLAHRLEVAVQALELNS